MVDFKKLREAKAKPKPVHPRDIFNTLPKPPGINDLYASQAEVLDGWYARRTERDTVVKLHTGGGKTLVALLMAQSVMNEAGEPVIYLAPTNQLVDQVIAKSREYGISAARYMKGQPLPSEFYDGTSVLVGSYEALFNGRSKFGVRGSGKEVVKAGAIILDDAHVALGSVRDAFTLDISAKDHKDVYTELASRFRPRSRKWDAADRSQTSFAERSMASSRCRAGLGIESLGRCSSIFRTLLTTSTRTSGHSSGITWGSAIVCSAAHG